MRKQPHETLCAWSAAVLLATVLLVAAPSSSAAPSRLVSAVDAVIAAGAPGVVVYVRDHDRTTVVTRGYADLATKRPASLADHFRIGSLTKSFVATVILQLSAERKLALDDPVAQYLPGVVPNGGAITLRELLSHRSGLFDYFNDSTIVAPYLAGHLGHVWTPLQLVQHATRHKPLFAPGAPGKQSYSNTGYQVLGLVIEKITGHSLASELRRRIIRPLRLNDTSFPTSTAMPSPYAHGYSKALGPPLRDLTRLSPSLAGPAGALISTPADVARFYRALFQGRLIPKRLVEQMKTRLVTIPGAPKWFVYGLGLYRKAFSCSWVWGHNGDFPGYETNAFGSGDGIRQIVVLVNSDEEGSWTDAESAAVNQLMDIAYCG
jgi:D-alanyl-D-alanine carboxypeptidase